MTEPRYSLEPIPLRQERDYGSVILALALVLMGIAFALGLLF